MLDMESVLKRDDIPEDVKEDMRRCFAELSLVHNTLQSNEAKFRNIFENTGSATCLFGEDGIIRECNTVFVAMSGFTREQIVGKMWWFDFVPKEEVRRMRANHIQRGKNPDSVPSQYECKILVKGNESRSAIVNISLVGETRIVSLIDITERKEMEQSLRESEARYKVLHDATFGGIAIHEKGRILECNQGLSVITGYPLEDLLGMDGLLLIAEESREEVVRNIQNEFEKPYRVFGVKKSGEKYHLRLEAKNITFQGKKVRVVEFRDVGEQVQVEIEQLRSQKLESLGVLAGGIAHDFNNLLVGILGNLSLLEHLKVELNKDQRTLVADAIVATTQASHLARRLLSFAKGGVQETKVASVADIVKEATTFSIGSAHHVKCVFDVSKDAANAKIDIGQIYQVFYNLATNARQAMQNGGEIHVSIENVFLSSEKVLEIASDGWYVCVCVTDTGEGMSPEMMDRIFEPYFTTKNTGSGLGLAITHRVVKDHNGFITVDSVVGEGTTFRVYLPASNETVQGVEEVNESDKHTDSVKILIMDDEPMVRNVLKLMLATFGHTVVEAQDGQEALQKYVEVKDMEPFDLVILDLTIPGGMGGEKTLERLREIHPEVLAIASSGHSDKFPEGFTASLSKPYSVSELSEVITEVLQRRK